MSIKKILVALRTSIKFMSLLSIAIILVVGLVSFIYRPTYIVEINGEQVGYTNNKSQLQKKINKYIESGEDDNVGFVQIDELPTYKLCLLKKDVQTNDDEIFETVKSTGVVYYKYYAVLRDDEEKFYVSTVEEAEEAVAKLKEKQGTYVQNFGILEKYAEEIKEFTETEEIVAALYVAPPVVAKASSNVTSRSGGGNVSMSGNNTSGTKVDIGITLSKPTAGTVTSKYGPRGSGFHTGIDIGAKTGTAINAAYGGTITHASYWGGYGNLIIIAHGNGIQTYYAHCSRMDVKVGDTVSQGDLIGAVGSTGNSTGPHLHFEVRVNGVSQNPQNYVY